MTDSSTGEEIQPILQVTTVSANYTVVRTGPEYLQRHDISDEELSLLCMDQRNIIQDAFWASIGIGGGSIVSAITSASKLFAEEPKFAGVDLVNCSLFLAAAVVFAFTLLLRSKKPVDATTLADKIRARITKSDS